MTLGCVEMPRSGLERFAGRRRSHHRDFLAEAVRLGRDRAVTTSVSPLDTAAPRAEDSERGTRGASENPKEVGLFGADRTLQIVIGALVVAYWLSTFFAHRNAAGYSAFWDGWEYTVTESLPLIPMLLCTRRVPRTRIAWLVMACGVVLNAAGDLVYTYHDQNLAKMPDLAPSDVLYLSSYLSYIVGVTLLTQGNLGRVHVSVRLDGAISGLALASLAGLLWFDPLLHVSGHPLAVAVHMAYPLCDLVLLVLLVAGLAPRHYRPNRSTGLFMLGVFWLVVGDVIYLSQSAAGTYKTGGPLDATWVTAPFLMGMAASVRDRRRSASRDATKRFEVGRAVVPGVFGLVSIGVIAGSVDLRHSPVVLFLALGALVLVIDRMWIISSKNYQDARTDVLTGLANRRHFLERIQSELFASRDRAAGMILIDLDGFKEVNDALGHAMGDELLCIVARRFENQVGNRAVLARLGGDEFACAAHVVDERELVALARRLAGALSQPCTLDGVSVQVGASIGLALSDDDGLSAAELLRNADVAMYEAKRSHAVISVYRAAEDPNSREHLELLSDLRAALDDRALTLHFQPTLDMRTGAIRGVEALARWHHPEHGLLYPDRFIPMAERSGLMPLVTRAVLDLAIAEAARLDRGGRHLEMSVNISQHDLVDADLPDYIEQVLALHGFPHERLTLEITESAFGSDPARAERCVQELRARGLRIAIDDFGVGYSSMSQLLGLAIDELKIDRSFVFELCSDPRAQAIVRSAIELARALGLTVVAEGIEREDVLDALQGIGADIGQGYFIARPLTSEQLDAFLSRDGLGGDARPDRTLAASPI